MKPELHSGFSQFGRSLKQLLFPGRCLACNTALHFPLQPPELMLCPECIAKIRLHDHPLCTCCGRPFPNSSDPHHLCEGCLRQEKFFHKARAVLLYTEPFISIIQTFKYHGSNSALKTFAALFAMNGNLPSVKEADIIAPVPLHAKRLRQRGFNQALVLARTFFPGQYEKIASNLLIRTRDTRAQAGLNGAERRKNLKNAFSLSNPEKVKGRTILLIDDVYTTGTTVNECSRQLRNAGSRKVNVVTLARVRE